MLEPLGFGKCSRCSCFILFQVIKFDNVWHELHNSTACCTRALVSCSTRNTAPRARRNEPNFCCGYVGFSSIGQHWCQKKHKSSGTVVHHGLSCSIIFPRKQPSWGCILHFRATFWALASTVHQGSASSSIKRRSGQISLLWLLNSVDCCYGAFGTCSHVGMGHDGSQNLYVLNDLPFIWRNSMFIDSSPKKMVFYNQDARVGPIHRFLRRSWAWAAPDIGWWGVPNYPLVN